MINTGVAVIRSNPNAIADLMKRIEAIRMTVGVHADQKDDKDGPMAIIAGVHEFGSTHVPARPFIRPTIVTRREEYTKMLRGALKKAIRTGQLRQSMGVLGEAVVRDMQRTIRAQGEPAGSFAPLAPATVAQRRKNIRINRNARGQFTRDMMILIDSGRLINSIRWVLESGPGAT